MEKLEMATAHGEGLWGNQKYRVRLETERRDYTDSSGEVRKTLLSYLFTFECSSPLIRDRRIFASEEKRRIFLGQSFTELRLEEIPEGLRRWEKVPSPLQSIVGCALTEVEFVTYYLQLKFPPYRFSIYNWPVLVSGGETKRLTDEGYREMLQTFVGRRISRIEEYIDRGLTLEFGDGSSISVAIKVDSNYSCPEVAEVSGPKLNCYVWQINDPPFG
jgi:hypothetical protein